MITSVITGKTYDPSDAVYFFLDILWASEKRKYALVFVWKKCPETKRAKELWDKHEL